MRSRRPAPPGVRGQGAQAATRAPARFAPIARETHLGAVPIKPEAQRGAPFLRLRKNGRTSEHGRRGRRGHPTRTRYSLLGVERLSARTVPEPTPSSNRALTLHRPCLSARDTLGGAPFGAALWSRTKGAEPSVAQTLRHRDAAFALSGV